MQFQMQKSIDINAPADTVWATVTGEFGDVAKWSSGLAASHIIVDAQSGQATGRVCEPYPNSLFGNDPVEEELTELDHAIRCLTYRATKLPKGFRNAQNRWCIVETGANSCRLEISPTAEMNPFFGLLFKASVGKIVSDALEELKHYLETGQLHPRKLKADAKAAKRLQH